MKKQRSVCIACILAAALVCIGGLVYVLVISGTQQRWDEINMTYGLEAEGVKLDRQEQKNVDELIWNYDFRELSQEEMAKHEMLYGGTIVNVEFIKDGTSHCWEFTENNICHTKYEQDKNLEVQYYASDRQILRKLEKYFT